MCGIAGAFLPDKTLSQERLLRATQLLQHRGPDGTGYHCEGDISLIHTRLSIIDLSSGAQPLYSPDRQLVLVANGEIYNYIELRNSLEKKGYRFKTNSDCEVLLYLYQEDEQNFLDSVLGMFSVAIWNNRKQQLILARDRLGIKPLFYRQCAEGFYFGSELKSLVAISGLTPEVNPASLVQFLGNNFITGEQTIIQSINKVEPGTIIRIKKGRISSSNRYWSLSDLSIPAINEESAFEHFDHLMDTVMRIHMRSDVPFGLFLSGGVDSSVLLALLVRFSDKPVSTYSAGFPDSSVNDELPVATGIANRFGTEHTVFSFTGKQMLLRLPKTVWAADDLMCDYASLPTALMSEQAGHELKVMFSGEGGDEVFAGYGRYRPNMLKRFRQMLRGSRTGGFRSKNIFNTGIARQLLTPTLQKELHAWNRDVENTWCQLPGNWSKLQKMQATDMKTWLADDLLVKADRMMMAYGLEGRVPFLDHRVVEFGLALPDHLKICRKTGKYFLKKWAERFLPAEHLYQRKRGFTVPVRDWLASDLLNVIEQHVHPAGSAETFISRTGLHSVIQTHRKNGQYTSLLWATLQFLIWHRIMIDQNMEMPDDNTDLIQFFNERP